MLSIAIILFLTTAEGYHKPAPKLVYPRLLEERSSEGRMVLHVHEDLTLNLRKASVAAPKLRVLDEEGGVTVTRFYEGVDIEKHLYEDEEKIATVHVTRSEHGIQIKGLVGPRHRIGPMPVLERIEEGSIPHMMHEIEEEEMVDKYVNMEIKDNPNFVSERQNRVPYWGPEVVQVEIFIVSDERHYKHFQTTELALQYLCVIINAANLRFSAAKLPKIRLVLVGLEKLKQQKFDPKSDGKYIFDEAALKGLNTYAVRKRSDFGKPDVVYYITGMDVTAMVDGKYSTRGLGIGYLAGVCTDAYVALGEDKAELYSGMHTFIHEIAHTLGATHDGSDSFTAIKGHPSAKSCLWDLGYIMSYKNVWPSHHHFSTCSLAQMQFVIRLRGRTCWAVAGAELTFDGVYPGMNVSFQAFCADVFPDTKNVTFDFVNKTTCKVRCKYDVYQPFQKFGRKYQIKRTFYTDADALDYMPCDANRVCIRGECVAHKPTEKTTSTTKTMTTTKKAPEAVTTKKTPETMTTKKTPETMTTKTTPETVTPKPWITTSNCPPCDCSSQAPSSRTWWRSG